MIALFLAVEARDDERPLVVRFTGERITYVGRTETERKPTSIELVSATWKELNRTHTAW